MPQRTPVDDQDLQRMLGQLLRAGVLVSAAIVILGTIVSLAGRGLALPPPHVFRGEPSALRRLGPIVREALALRGPGLIQLGLVLLMATPVARVVLALAGFVLQRDRIYVIATLLVLATLLYGLLGGPV